MSYTPPFSPLTNDATASLEPKEERVGTVVHPKDEDAHQNVTEKGVTQADDERGECSFQAISLSPPPPPPPAMPNDAEEEKQKEEEKVPVPVNTPSPSSSIWKGESAKEARFRGRCMPESFHRLLYAATSGNDGTTPIASHRPPLRPQTVSSPPQTMACNRHAATAMRTHAEEEIPWWKREEGEEMKKTKAKKLPWDVVDDDEGTLTSSLLAGNEEREEREEEETVHSTIPLDPFGPSSSSASLSSLRFPSGCMGGGGGYAQPAEANDVEDLLKGHTDYMDLPPERRVALRRSVKELHDRVMEWHSREAAAAASRGNGAGSDGQEGPRETDETRPTGPPTPPTMPRHLLETLRVRASRLKGFKDTARKSELTAAYRELVREGVIPTTDLLSSLLLRKQGKSHSGVLVITVLMGPGEFSCPKDCYYCPNQPGVARSYLLKEPAVLRGFRNGWDPVRQFYDRASALEGNGHVVDKVELIILGGTFSFYPAAYAEQFIGACFYAANTFYASPSPNTRGTSASSSSLPEEEEAASGGGSSLRPMKSIAAEIHRNETARCRIIGVTVETRPDYITARELRRFRHLGVTRVQLGIQHLDDAILTLINRDCPTYKAAAAIERLLNAGFKVDAHWMPDLPGSSFEKDMEMFQLLLDDDLNENFQVDQWKVYPTATVPFTRIREWYEQGTYKPYAEVEGGKYMVQLLTYIMTHAPYRLRLNRIVRDIPTDYIEGGEKRVNLRQVIERQLKQQAEVAEEEKKKEEEEGAVAGHTTPTVPRCRDIRERECKNSLFREEELTLFIDHHRASGGTEYYIAMENKDRTQLYGHLRLRIRDDVKDPEQCLFPVLQGAALIRELHTYGTLVAVHHPSSSASSLPTGAEAQDDEEEEVVVEEEREEEHDESPPCRAHHPPASPLSSPPPHARGRETSRGADRTSHATQHRGVGTRLMQEAEKLAFEKYGLTKYVVIAGVGVRKYYARLGYRLEDTYMVKYRVPPPASPEEEEEARGSNEKEHHAEEKEEDNVVVRSSRAGVSSLLAMQRRNRKENEWNPNDDAHPQSGNLDASTEIPCTTATTTSVGTALVPFSLLPSWSSFSASVRQLTKKVGDKVRHLLPSRKRSRSEEEESS